MSAARPQSARRPYTLVVLAGLPGTGKTSIGKALAIRCAAVYLRVDEIEHVLRSDPRHGADVGTLGYVVAQAIALSNLKLGNCVIADSVNPVPESREAWRAIARRAACPALDVEVICSDAEEHRRRVESRTADIEGLRLPAWASVKARDYAPMTEPRLVVDTAALSIDDAVSQIESRMGASLNDAG